jgi:hypothetical protein
MTTERDTERLLRQWLDEGPTRAADRLLETVEERIDRQRQRPAWRLSWRNLFMNRTIGSFAAGMAVVAVALVGFSVVSGQGTKNGGTGGAAEPTAAAAPSPTPTPSLVPSDAPAVDQGLAWTFEGTLPTGWELGDGAFNGEDVTIEVLENRSVMATNCQFGPAEGIGTSASEIVDTIAARDGLEVTDPVATTIGGLSGREIDLHLAADWAGTCPWWEGGTQPVVPLYGAFNEKNYWFYNAVPPEEQYRVQVLDAPSGGNVVIAFVAPTAEQFETHEADATSIVEGIVFDTSP